MRASAAAKINLALVVGPTRDDGKHEVATVYQRLAIADRLELESASELLVEGFDADTLVRGALEALGARAGVEPRWHVRIEKRLPIAAGIGGGSSDAATALRLANATLGEPLPDADLREIAAGLGADVPFFLVDGPQLGTGDGRVLKPLDLPQDFWVVLLVPRLVQKPSTASVYAAFDLRDGAAGFDERRAALLAALDEVRRPRRPRRVAAERPRLVAARRRAARARRVPRRRHRRGAGRVRALPSQGPRAGGAARAEGRRRELADRTCVVRLTRLMDSSHAIEHGTSRSGRWLRSRRTRIALWIAAAEAIIVAVFHDVSRFTVIALAIAAVILYWYGGRRTRSDTFHQASWIFAVSQLLAVVAAILAFVVFWTAIVFVCLFALVALFFVFTDRR